RRGGFANGFLKYLALDDRHRRGDAYVRRPRKDFLADGRFRSRDKGVQKGHVGGRKDGGGQARSSQDHRSRSRRAKNEEGTRAARRGRQFLAAHGAAVWSDGS